MKQYLGILFGFILLVQVSCLSDWKSNVVPVESFFASPEKMSFKISPDGKYIAYIGVEHHCKNIFILDLQHAEKSKQLTHQQDINVHNFFWGNAQEIIFSNSQGIAEELSWYKVHVENEEIQALASPANSKTIWITQQIVDNSLLVAMNDRDSSVFDAYRFYLDGRPKQLLARNPGNVISWYASGDNELRLATTSDSVQESLLYRAGQAEQYHEISRNSFHSNLGFLGFVKNSTSRIYALSNLHRDKLALIEYDLDNAQEVREIYSNALVDIDFAGYSKQSQELFFASYTDYKTGKKVRHFFNTQAERAYQMVREEVGDFEFSIVDRDSAMQHLIIRTFTDRNPGAIYHLDMQQKKLHKLADINPELKDRELARKEAVTYSSRDGMSITGFLTYPTAASRQNMPVVVLPHDGPSGRDVWGFDPEVQFLANRGYVVFQMNYRGSSGFGKEFWMAGFKQWGGKIQDDITDGVRWLIREGIADKKRIAIVGKGFGGYSALHGACFNSNLYTCAVSLSGYMNLFSYFRDIPPYYKPYLHMYYQMIGNPEYESDMFKATSPVFHSDKVRIPTMLVLGDRDKFNSLNDANQFVQKLRTNQVPVRFIVQEGENGRFKKEENIISYYQELHVFLAQNLKN